MKDHCYKTTITWTGNKGYGTKSSQSYDRDHTIAVEGKPEIPGTSEVSMKGNKVRYNPEELLLASLSACHMLWFLSLCAKNQIVVTEYEDKATGVMVINPASGGHFAEAVLNPEITIAGQADEQLLEKLQLEAGRLCFIANSCNFPVKHKPVYLSKSA